MMGSWTIWHLLIFGIALLALSIAIAAVVGALYLYGLRLKRPEEPGGVTPLGALPSEPYLIQGSALYQIERKTR